MSQKPFFSIIIPTFNRSYILWKTILGIQGQSMGEWELLIIDDGSTDATKKVVREFQSDHRIHYFYKSNGGASSARNLGMEKAQGEIITYVDSDDLIFQNYLSTAKDFFNKYSTKSFAHSNCNRILEYYDEQGLLKEVKDTGPAYQKEITLQDFYDWNIKPSIGTGFFHKNHFFKGKLRWNEEMRLLENLDFIMQLACIDPSGFFCISQILYEYRQKYGEDGICSQASYEAWAKAFRKIHDLHYSDTLMRNPEIYIMQEKKYHLLHEQMLNGEAQKPVYKYFTKHSSNIRITKK